MFGMSVESRALKYGYSNARVKAMKGLLLKASVLDDLVRCGSIEAMVELLQRTHYKGDFAVASTKYSGSELVELAASKNFARTIEKLIRITPQNDKPLLRALLLKYDLLNLKTIMHAKSLNKSYDEVRPYLLPAGGLTEDDFKRIISADRSGVVREIKRTELGKQMLAQSTGMFSKKMWLRFKAALKNLDTFLQMETIIDAYVYLLMDKALSESRSSDVANVRRIMKYEIDAKNILIIERLKKHNAGRKLITDTLIRGGTLSDATINRIIDSKDVPSTVKIVKNKFRMLEMEKEELIDLEMAFEKSIAAQKSVIFHRATLSVGVIIGFLLLKEEEVNNLRKIAKGKEFGFSDSDVREMLVVV